MIEPFSSLLLSTGLLRLKEEAFLLHGFAFLSRDSSAVVHYLLVVLRDTLVGFKGKLFTSLMSFIELGLDSRKVCDLRLGLEAKLHSLVVIDDLLLGFSHESLTTFFSSGELALNLNLSSLNGLSFICLLALLDLLLTNSFVVPLDTFLDFSSLLEAKFFSSSKLGLIALSFERAVILGTIHKDFEVVLSSSLNGISSSLGSTSISCSKLVLHRKLLKGSLGLLLADSSLTCHLNARGQLESLQVLLSLSRGLVQLHRDLFKGILLLVWDKSKLEGSRRCLALGLFQVNFELDRSG